MIKCRFENDDEVSLRHVTVNAIVVKNGQILLGKRGLYKGKPILESGKWALLGGFFDRDESLKEAVKREVNEESGITVNGLVLLRINDNPDRPHEDRQNMDMVFIANYEGGELNQDIEETRQLSWFDINNLPSMEEFAFDHLEDIELYKKYLQGSISLPVLG